jgi:dihydrolipoamide dehydrogenase
MTSTEALRLEGIPGPLLVIGGGYIGLELGFVWAALGSPVTVVEMMDGLLPGADRDLVRPLHDRLGKMFRHIYLSTQVTRLEETDQGIRAHLKGDNLEDPAPVFEKVLVAVGRKPASQNLGLEKAGVEVNEKGFVKIDRKCRTTAERILAIGDVAGEPMLAHKASHEARVAIEVIAGEPAELDYRCIPAVVFTDPELAWCGLTESAAKKAGREVEVARYPWAASGRAETLHRTEGLTKLIVDPGTDQLLGVGIVGPGAGEMIAEAALAIEMGATARDLELTIHAHPTLSETLMEASELLHGSATHLYRPRRG